MLTIISPATTMKFDKNTNLDISSKPYFYNDANYLMSILKNLSLAEVQNLMNLSEDLGHLNLNRYKEFGSINNPKSQSILAFDGEVFNCMDVSTFNNKNFNFANTHLRILSGLYGVLSPFDLIEPYRLEMKSKLENESGANLYKFWKSKITNYLIEEIKKHDNKIILNLASSEYVKAIDLKKLNNHCKFINVDFKDYNNNTGKFRVIGMYSKQSRGYMTRFIIENEIDNINDLKDFQINGYKFNNELSDDLNLIFTR
ncbi:peroxide stress protein YaaA [Romboutsia sp. CE17]|uniref:peroxide stress protein YaaA n=1 Tax=Romboutsia sp. CE17 TaxID=2724150 RepID=UPI001442B349|nr:peroxide stress protein YaaA [Romboutsia sp. CE17]QJA08361.1 peroxide stress protein YaaA [Romboutsia sp. CE17]